MSIKEEFYNDVIITLINKEDLRIKEIIVKDGTNSGFYEVCRSYLNIALNSKKFYENGEIAGCFQFSDIDNAKMKTKHFVKKYDITDVEHLLDIVFDNYKKTISPNESKNNSGVVRNKNTTDIIGLYGVYYDFTELPIWDKLKSKVIEYVSK